MQNSMILLYLRGIFDNLARFLVLLLRENMLVGDTLSWQKPCQPNWSFMFDETEFSNNVKQQKHNRNEVLESVEKCRLAKLIS